MNLDELNPQEPCECEKEGCDCGPDCKCDCEEEKQDCGCDCGK